jgi:hopanoid biosynthesis associated RND transporter like protein HpnN
MLSSLIARIVDACTRSVWIVIAAAVVVTAVCGQYAAKHFAINTDIQNLISSDLPWRQREMAYEKAFPQGMEMIAAVVKAPTPELAGMAAKELAGKLGPDTSLFHSVQESGGAGDFFARHRLLFMPTEELAQNLAPLTRAGPLLGALSSDPSLRGLVQALTFGLMGVRSGEITLDGMTRPLTMAATTVEDALAGRRAVFSWYELVNGRAANESELRQILTIRPVLDYNALEPGAKASSAIRKAAADLGLEQKYGATVRLTGPVPIADEEFGSLKENAELNAAITIAVVLGILFLALRSGKIILAVFLNLVVGLVTTAALGLYMVGALNLISIAFAVLFVGLGVDFGIQYSVRYRAERYECADLREALIRAGKSAGAQLTLAAAATTAAFFSFLPTEYRGISELGLIAGCGMSIAFLSSITLLPALIKLFNPPGEPEALGFSFLAPLDRFFERHRIPVIVVTLLVAIGGLPLLMHLRFDFNPMNLRSPKVESIATYLDLAKDPQMNVHTAEVLAPSVDAAAEIAKKLSALPQVARAVTLDSFVPEDQDAKLAIIQKTAKALQAQLNPSSQRPAPSDAEIVTALRNGATNLKIAADRAGSGTGADAARRLSGDLVKLAEASPDKRAAVTDAMVPPLVASLAGLKDALSADAVSRETLPAELASNWVAPDGRARVEVAPKGDTSQNDTIRHFAEAVLAAEPGAVGEAIGILESGDTVVRAFLHAGLWALASITLLLWIVLRRFGDVLLTLVPLILAGVLTLEICVLLDFPMNFANIIALPLLLGVGVAFKIYYVMAWRAGQTDLLQSSLTRAVVYSALTTATAFGSLWFSSHPGTSSMGELLALALCTTMLAAVLFQPALMGPPRVKDESQA